MKIVHYLFGWLFHIDSHLELLVVQYHVLSYIVLGAIVFLENGVVFFPFLPGDSLLFVCGAFAGKGSFNFFLLFTVLWVSGVLGSILNYFVGRWAGEAFEGRNIPFVRQRHIDQTKAFFERYGAVTLIAAKFFPVVRTFAPFLSGVGRMDFRLVILSAAVGTAIWVAVFLGGGYLFGSVPIIAENMVAVVMGILLISLIPLLVRGLIARRSLLKTSKTR
ncbi:hypothetical protein EB093_05900 [bacterium]|nr:hypothetical protein [bacterium]